MKNILILFSILLFSCSKKQYEQKKTSEQESQVAFPYILPKEKPNRPLSIALERLYSNYLAPRPENNELYTRFKYTKLNGFDYNQGDGTISRRDPSKIILANGKFYIWYTHRNTPVAPIGMHRANESNDTIPTTDWDLSDIYYATSEDGFTWEERGVAVPRPPKPNPGWRSVATTDILKWKDKYYLYYQAFSAVPGKNGGDYCPVAVSYADSPDGPWVATNKIVIPNGKNGEWDSNSIHDPYPLVHNGKIYMYYKSDFGKSNSTNMVRMSGLAIADDPLGPFKKHSLNPLINSGHETTLFPFKQGVAALVIRDGTEKNTIQYAKDWVNFEIASFVEMLPDAAGPFVKDAFINTTDGEGILWGISHFTTPNPDLSKNHTLLLRFDCELSASVDDQSFKNQYIRTSLDFFLENGLSKEQKKRIQKEISNTKNNLK